MKALKEIQKDKLRVARAYNKKVKDKFFQVGDLVWKTILPVGMKSNKFGNGRQVGRVHIELLKLSSAIPT